MNHHLNNYVIGGLALTLAAAGYYDADRALKHAVNLDSAVSHIAPEVHSRLSWPSLTQDQTIALGEALKRLSSSTSVTIYCASSNCAALRNDLDDAFQIAGWPSTFEDQFVDSEEDEGLFVGPVNSEAADLAGTITGATGIAVKPVGIDGIKGVGVIIGKRPSAQ